MADEVYTRLGRPKRLASSKRITNSQASDKREIRKKLKKVQTILKKNEMERTADEVSTLCQLPDIVETAEKNAKRQQTLRERVLEIEDAPEHLDEKCRQLAQFIQSAKNVVIYTGAGISTAASIPDYRGPNGVWTMLKQGRTLSAQDLVDAEPTYTHMCITKLFREGRVKYLVSQNCDGLHIRSGYPRNSLSEVHGNMYIEVCRNCKPQKEFIRLFDVTERTSKRRHKTGRTCNKCGGHLYDTIIHFGEKGGLKSPYKWKQAAKAASKADLILCLGSSLKVLRCYPCLWRMDVRPEHRPKVVIVNLQWTPKDDTAILKIHGRCDEVMRRVAHHLRIVVPHYNKASDPLFRMHTQVKKGEVPVANKKSLTVSSDTASGVCGGKSKRARKLSKRPSPLARQPNPLFHNDCENVPVDVGGYLPRCEGAKPHPSMTNSFRVPGALLQAGHQEVVCKHGVVCRNDQEYLVSGDIHINDPVKQRLVQMLKERGLAVPEIFKTETRNGKLQNAVCNLDEDFNSICLQNFEETVHQTFGSAAEQINTPLPSILNFLPSDSLTRTDLLTVHSKCNTDSQQSSVFHPQLCDILNRISDPQFDISGLEPLSLSIPQIVQPEAALTQQGVFRVDLSTEPISITYRSSLSDLTSLMFQLSADGLSNVLRATCNKKSSRASIPISYATLLQRISFDHAYCKNPSKTSGKGGGISTKSAPKIEHHRPSEHCHQPVTSAQPVIPSAKNLDCVIPGLIQDSVSVFLSDKELLSAVRQVIGGFDLQSTESHGPHCPLTDSVNHSMSTGQVSVADRVVVNLNSNVSFQNFHCQTNISTDPSPVPLSDPSSLAAKSCRPEQKIAGAQNASVCHQDISSVLQKFPMDCTGATTAHWEPKDSSLWSYKDCRGGVLTRLWETPLFNAQDPASVSEFHTNTLSPTHSATIPPPDRKEYMQKNEGMGREIRRDSGTVPGWFGKGLKVRRKRTL